MPVSERAYVERVLEVENLLVEPQEGESMVMFRLEVADSVMVVCDDCRRLLNKGDGQAYFCLRHAEDKGLKASDFGRWVRNPSKTGTFALVLGGDRRSGVSLKIGSLAVMRKTRDPLAGQLQVQRKLVEFIDLPLPKADLRSDDAGTVFYFKLRESDKVSYTYGEERGLKTSMLEVRVFKAGEEFAKQPIPAGAPVALPGKGDGTAKFGFQLADVRSSPKSGRYSLILEVQPTSAGQPGSGSK